MEVRSSDAAKRRRNMKPIDVSVCWRNEHKQLSITSLSMTKLWKQISQIHDVDDCGESVALFCSLLNKDEEMMIAGEEQLEFLITLAQQMSLPLTLNVHSYSDVASHYPYLFENEIEDVDIVRHKGARHKQTQGKESKRRKQQTDTDTEEAEVRPNQEQRYRKTKEDDTPVICAFCRHSSDEEEFTHILGPMYGPFASKSIKHYAHELCALWSPEIYLETTTNKMQNVVKAIKRGRRLNCSHCRQKGASLGCAVVECKKTYHVLCMKLAGCKSNRHEFIAYCPAHAHLDRNDDSEEERSEIVAPTGVNGSLDPSILAYETAPFDPVRVLVCKICTLGDRDEQMLICDACENGFHMDCLDPPLTRIPQGKWFCNGQCKQRMMQKAQRAKRTNG
eukprot:GILJ01015948.1.p1 GENE.GILJ01015948.1~~GILJ01015948.1.p1  ORF type:complete len:413 (-),score=47.78 GILJ01015948.1:160-1335(-)